MCVIYYYYDDYNYYYNCDYYIITIFYYIYYYKNLYITVFKLKCYKTKQKIKDFYISIINR